MKIKLRYTITLLLMILTGGCSTPVTVTASPTPIPTPLPITSPVHYMLHEPSADEYFRAVPVIIDLMMEDVQPGEFPTVDIPEILVEEIRRESYLDEAEDESVVFEAYWSIANSYGYWYGREEWNHAILEKWLNAERPDLDSMSQTHFENYQIDIEARDFDGDQHNEWVLHVVQGEGDASLFRQIVVVRSTEAGKYEIVPSPIPWHGCCFHYSSTLSGTTEEMRYEDLTGDGLPEWVLIVGGMGVNHLHFGWILVLGWQDGKLVDLVPEADLGDGLSYLEPAGGGYYYLPRDVSWEYANVDSDAAIEIHQYQVYHDNWACTLYETRVFEWMPDQYSYSYVQTVNALRMENSAGCLVRQGQLALWEGNISEAASFFEAALTLNIGVLSPEVHQYIQLRLALAYQLLGRSADTTNLLADLNTQEPASELTARLIGSASQSELSPGSLALCAALYNVFATSDPWDTGTYWGAVQDRLVPMVSIESPAYDAERAGCNFPTRVKTVLSSHRLSVLEPIDAQLNSLGIGIRDYQLFDLDRDEQKEILLWTIGEGMPPLLLVSGGDQYIVTSPGIINLKGLQMDREVLFSDMRVVQLPDGKLALATMFYDGRVRDVPGTMNSAAAQLFYAVPLVSCTDGWAQKLGYLRLWRLEGDELVQFFDMILCENRDLSAFFPDDQGKEAFVGWASADGHRWVESQYKWNDARKTYVAQLPDPVNTPEVASQAEPTIYDVLASIYRQDIPDASIAEFDVALNSLPPDVTPEAVFEARYWRAYLLLKTGRRDDALAAYLAIYNETPESAWGLLALLHLEPLP
jgi:tetratricopeptide (TPR) repeat protein